MSSYFKFIDNMAFHPGFYIEELMLENEMSLEDFAKHLGISPKKLQRVIQGKQMLDDDLVVKLASVMGTDVDLWLNLQSSYETFVTEYLS